MVNIKSKTVNFAFIFAVIFALCGPVCSPAVAMLPQTEDDLRYLEDYLQTRFENDADLRRSISPLLVTPPQHIWEESRSDFSPSSVAILKKLLPDQGQLIFCEECGSERLRIGKDHTISLSAETCLSRNYQRSQTTLGSRALRRSLLCEKQRVALNLES